MCVGFASERASRLNSWLVLVSGDVRIHCSPEEVEFYSLHDLLVTDARCVCHVTIPFPGWRQRASPCVQLYARRRSTGVGEGGG